ncbi:hypothetical protein ACFL96_15140 [Thermoproteota archaeon]
MPLNNQWKYIGIAIIIGIVIIASAVVFLPPSTTQEDDIDWVPYQGPIIRTIGGKYDTSLSMLGLQNGFESGDIIYTRDGVQVKGYFYEGFKFALDYLKTNSPDDSIIFAWWDYGNMIIGYGEREALATNPSERLLEGITVTNATIETDPEEILADIGKAYTTKDPEETLRIMKKYDSEYILVPAGPLGDEGKAKWLFFAAGISFSDMDNYWVDGKLVKEGRNIVLYKMLNEEPVNGFKLIFSDQNTKIYQISS